VKVHRKDILKTRWKLICAMAPACNYQETFEQQKLSVVDKLNDIRELGSTNTLPNRRMSTRFVSQDFGSNAHQSSQQFIRVPRRRQVGGEQLVAHELLAVAGPE
jgi:hypothetical protein